jgi:methyl-accepting chemotaxis protein
MATRPLDRLTSIRVKLGSIIVFAVAVTILVMYIGVGFAVRRSERDRQFRELLVEAKAISALGFSASGRPSGALLRAIQDQPNVVVVVDRAGDPLVGDLLVPASVNRALAGFVDTGLIGKEEYLGVPITRSGSVIGAVYLAHRVEGGGLIGAIQGTANFVRGLWWQLLLAGAIAGFIALFLARLLARGMTQPLRDMAHAVRAMARGVFRERVNGRSRDEVGQLAEAL